METGKINKFKSFLYEKGLKLTKERLSILSGLETEKGHFSVDMLVERLNRKDKKVSRDTVYRNLHLLLETGILRQSFRTNRDTYYEIAGESNHHDHVVCRKCGKVLEFANPAIERAQNQVANQLGFKMESHLHQLIGLCMDCKT